MRYKQCQIINNKARMIVWLDATKAKEGARVTLKDSEAPDEWWLILEVFSSELETQDINKYHNPKKLFGSINK